MKVAGKRRTGRRVRRSCDPGIQELERGPTLPPAPLSALQQITQSARSSADTLKISGMSQQDVIHAYRHLYRHGLRAIQFSKPARFTLRDRLRLAFRKGSAADFESQKIQNTLEFLHYATTQNGLEHKIIKNLLFVWWSQEKGGKGKPTAKHQ